MQQGLIFGRCICKKHYVIYIVCVSNSFCRLSSPSCFFSVKEFSFIRSIVIQSTSSRQIINRYEANVSPRRTSVTTSKQKRLCLHLMSECWLSCYNRASFFSWGDHMLELFAPSFPCVWNEMLWRNLRKRVSPRRFLPFYDSMDCYNLYGVDRFLRKPFWFFLRIFSISGPIRLRSKAL